MKQLITADMITLKRPCNCGLAKSKPNKNNTLANRHNSIKSTRKSKSKTRSKSKSNRNSKRNSK